MGNGLIFPYCQLAFDRWGDAGEKVIRLTDACLSPRAVCRKIRTRKPGGECERTSAKSLDQPPRKSSRELRWYPYQN